MKKLQYIQPTVESFVMPAGALMDFQGSPGQKFNPAPGRYDGRRTEVF